MLPLWIIDITQESDRCSALKQIIGQIDRVLLNENADAFLYPQQHDFLSQNPNIESEYECLVNLDPALSGISKSMRIWEQFGVLSDAEEKE